MTSIYILAYSTDEEIIKNKLVNVDIAVIFGAAVWGKNKPSPILKERVLKGFELYDSGSVHLIAVTGGGAKGELSESEVAKKLLLSKGVNESDIIIERETSSTIEQVHYIRDSLFNFRGLKKIVIVSDFFHLRRISEICILNGFKVYGISSTHPLNEEKRLWFVLRESFGLIIFWNFGV